MSVCSVTISQRGLLMKAICLVACAARKHEGVHAAKDLYDSALFQKSRRFAESRADIWYILSAKHGLLDPEKRIGKYDNTLNTMSKLERADWSDKVLSDLSKLIASGDRVIILAGKNYREFLEQRLRNLGIDIKVPMEGMRIGQQLQWLHRNIRE